MGEEVMAITATITEYSFKDGFMSMDSTKDNFSYEGLRQLYYYLEELSDGIGEDIEFDPIAFCMDYAEYGTFKELKDNYSTVDDQELEDNIIYECEDFILVRQF